MVRHNNNSYNSCFLKGIILPSPSIFYYNIFIINQLYSIIKEIWENTYPQKTNCYLL